MTQPAAIEQMDQAELVELARRIAGALERVGKDGPTGGDAQVPESFATLKDACRYLASRGWRCSIQKLSRDNKAGLIARDEATGHFLRATLDKYGPAYCRPLAGHDADSELERWQRAYQKARSQREEIRKERDAYRLAIEKGLYIPRESVDRMRAELMAMLFSDVDSFIQASAAAVIEAAGGDPDRLADVVAVMRREKARWMRRYYDAWQARTKILVPKIPEERILGDG